MSFQTAGQAKKQIQSLTESLWIFSVLNALLDTGAFAALHHKTSIQTFNLRQKNLPLMRITMAKSLGQIILRLL